MPEKEHKMLAWLNDIQQYRLPRWEELPDIELYMDQVITLIERYLTPLVGEHDSKVITPAMINNYVKLNIMPKPVKKRYGRTHLAYLIVITILKQVILITEVKEGIFLQSKLCSIPEAYNRFCDMQEKSLSEMAEILPVKSLPKKLFLPATKTVLRFYQTTKTANASACF